jgi:hypothetical protein
MQAMKFIWLVAMTFGLAAAAAHAAPGPWEQPAAALADQISAVLGPGQAHLTIRNLSSIPAEEIPSIQRLLVQDLKTHGITAAGADSANSIRVSLSESAKQRLWVAEIGEGNQAQVAIVRLGPTQAQHAAAAEGLTLLRQQLFDANEPVLAALETNAGLAVMDDEGIEVYAKSAGAWVLERRFPFAARNSLPRDPRGILISAADGNGFTAMTAGEQCAGSYAPQSAPVAHPGDGWTVQCHASDDPWPIVSDPAADNIAAGGAPLLSAFYNSARNYFTGVVAPAPGVDLPAFYSAVLIPRAVGSAALLMGGIDGKVQLVENGALKPIAGTRDWGSDFATIQSGCGTGPQIIASGSGQAASDSLRAYELPALDAVPASAPLAMEGTITALFAAPDGKSVLAVVRNAVNEYEVDRVTASCL